MPGFRADQNGARSFGLRRGRVFTAAMAALLLTSCANATTLRLIRPSEIHTSVKEGDSVRVVTKDAQVLEFEIVTVTPDAIVGRDQRVEIGNIATIEKREVSVGKAIGAMVLGGLFAVKGILAVVGLFLLAGA